MREQKKKNEWHRWASGKLPQEWTSGKNSKIFSPLLSIQNASYSVYFHLNQNYLPLWIICSSLVSPNDSCRDIPIQRYLLLLSVRLVWLTHFSHTSLPFHSTNISPSKNILWMFTMKFYSTPISISQHGRAFRIPPSYRLLQRGRMGRNRKNPGKK